MAFKYFAGNRVEVTRPTLGPAVQAVYATGTVEGRVMFELRPRQTGRLIELLAYEGDQVEEGQTLAQLEDLEQRAGIQELEAKAEFAKINLERQSNLFRTRSVSQEAVDRAKADWDAARSALAAMIAKADYMKLVSPDRCTVIKRDGEIGQLMSPEQVVFWLMCGTDLRVTAEVDEEDIALIKPGQKVLIRADAFPGETFESVVDSITPRGDPIARSFRVRINLPEKTPLMIGMTVENNIVIRESERSLLIPASALRNLAVWTIVDGKLAKQVVSVGARSDSTVEVLSGLSQSSLVVVNPDIPLTDGDSVAFKLAD